MKLYLLTYDAVNIHTSSATVYQYIKDSRHVLAFSHHYPGTYLVVSELSARDLAQLFRGVFTDPQGSCPNFLVSEIVVENIDGIMPQAAWHWVWDYRKFKDPLFGALLENAGKNNKVTK